MTDDHEVRTESFGQGRKLSLVDRFGVWLSARSVNKFVGDVEGLDFADIGCGFEATYTKSVIEDVRTVTLVDISLSDKWDGIGKVNAIRGPLPTALERLQDESSDVIVCLSVLEHLRDPKISLDHFFRILRPGGLVVINVPNWLGKRFLEFSAFKLNLSPPAEMDDHKCYYDPSDLWPMLVETGFPPHAIKCRRHKFGLNTIAVCRKEIFES